MKVHSDYKNSRVRSSSIVVLTIVNLSNLYSIECHVALIVNMRLLCTITQFLTLHYRHKGTNVQVCTK